MRDPQNRHEGHRLDLIERWKKPAQILNVKVAYRRVTDISGRLKKNWDDQSVIPHTGQM